MSDSTDSAVSPSTSAPAAVSSPSPAPALSAREAAAARRAKILARGNARMTAVTSGAEFDASKAPVETVKTAAEYSLETPETEKSADIPVIKPAEFGSPSPMPVASKSFPSASPTSSTANANANAAHQFPTKPSILSPKREQQTVPTPKPINNSSSASRISLYAATFFSHLPLLVAVSLALLHVFYSFPIDLLTFFLAMIFLRFGLSCSFSSSDSISAPAKSRRPKKSKNIWAEEKAESDSVQSSSLMPSLASAPAISVTDNEDEEEIDLIANLIGKRNSQILSLIQKLFEILKIVQAPVEDFTIFIFTLVVGSAVKNIALTGIQL